MATFDVNELVLIPDEDDQASHRKGRGAATGGKRFQYDPHLREEKLRQRARLCGSAAITCEVNGKRCVDVIAKLRKSKEGTIQIPPEILNYKLIGDVTGERVPYTIVTGMMEVDKVEDVRRKVRSLKAATEVYQALYHSVSAIHCDPKSLDAARGPKGESFPGLDGSGIIIGVVDFGCDFRHRNFRQASGATRLRYLWDQRQDKTEGKTDLPPSEYDYGREFSADRINQALRDEDKAYESLGYTPDIAAHGTHVMDIAAGNGREPNDFGGQPGLVPGLLSHPGIAPNAQLIFVHLRTAEGGFLGNSRYLLEAVDYIFKKADGLKMPAVVNLSLSSSGGPHDGTTLVEQGLAALVNAKPGRAVIVSAGNGFLKESHISDEVRKGGKATILWHTDPRHSDPERTKNEMEIWYRGDQTLRVTLYAPGSQQPVGTVDKGEVKELYDKAKGTRLGRVIHREEDPNNGDNHIDIRLPHLDGVLEPWKIELSTEDEQVCFHAWIEQDDFGLSRFEKSTTDSTIGSISCNDATLSVGAFDTALKACLALPFEASSAGPTRPTRRGTEPGRVRPDLSAPGVNIVAARARGGVTAMSGTSMAAPHVTGLIALLFQLVLRAGYVIPPFTRIRELLSTPADVDNPDSPKIFRRIVVDPAAAAGPQPPPHPQLGAGRVDGAEAVRFVATLLPDPEEMVPVRQSVILDQPVKSGPAGSKDFYIRAQLLPEFPDKEKNGTQDLGDLLKLLAERIEKEEGIRLWFKP
jgi:subtilisin family serine protease